MRLGFWAMHPVKGLGLLAAALVTVFWFVGLFGAGTLVDLLETGLFNERINPLAIRAADAVLPFPHTHASRRWRRPSRCRSPRCGRSRWDDLEDGPGARLPVPAGIELTTGQQVLRFFHDGLVGEYGLVTMALSYALAIVLPIVTTFFLLFSLLEDSGYLPRMSIMVNRVFRLMGLNGKAVLPMILGLGCDTMATMTTRVLETRKERIVTTMLLALAVPCSAQLGVLLAMMAGALPRRRDHLGGDHRRGDLPGRLADRTSLRRRGRGRLHPRDPADAPAPARQRGDQDGQPAQLVPAGGDPALRDRHGGALPARQVRALASSPTRASRWSPAGSGCRRKLSNAFLVGFMRRDFGAVYLLEAATGPPPMLSPHQILVAMVTITLFMPCIANFLMIAKEHGMKVAWAMAAFIFPFAFFVGGMVHRVAGWLIGS